MNIVILHLSLIDGIGPSTITRLMHVTEKLGISLPDLYRWNLSDFIQQGFSANVSQQLVHGLADKAPLEKELMLAQKHAISIITFDQPEYSALLREIHIPPAVLYIQGALDLLSVPSIAVVGSRQANLYAQKVIKAIIPALVDQKLVIVSGGALGADTMAHQETVHNHGKTVAVLGSGLLKPYPSVNKKLFESIVAADGAIISPFALEAQALPGYFPARNRIIAGLTQGCVVVQAAEQSGARITALFALEQGREVFAVPGTIDDPLSKGCHNLIKQGAHLVSCPEDILVELGYSTMAPQSIATTQSCEPVITDPFLAWCKEPKSFDELLVCSQLDFIALQGKLVNLQLNGKINQNSMGLWQSV